MLGLHIIRAPFKGLVFRLGKPVKVLEPGVHWVSPMISTIQLISTALFTAEVDIDVITKGGTPTSIKIGYTGRIKNVMHALVNVDDPFQTLRMSVIAVVSGAANSYSIDELAQYKTQIASAAQTELAELSETNGWGLGDFQIAIGDPSMTDELKRLLMREEAVKRENAANLERARNQLDVAKQLANVASTLERAPFARELLRLQMISDMGQGGKIVVVDSNSPLTQSPVAAQAIQQVAAQSPPRRPVQPQPPTTP